MTTTIISTVDNAKAGTALIAELVKAGLDSRDVEVLAGDHETIMSEIVDRGFDESDARDYLEAVEGGNSLTCPEDWRRLSAAIPPEPRTIGFDIASSLRTVQAQVEVAGCQ